MFEILVFLNIFSMSQNIVTSGKENIYSHKLATFVRINFNDSIEIRNFEDPCGIINYF